VGVVALVVGVAGVLAEAAVVVYMPAMTIFLSDGYVWSITC
jgi:hypothetical protein